MQMSIIFARTIILCAAVGLFVWSSAQADSVTSKGTASATFSGRATTAIKDQTLKDAKLNALDRYIADSNAAKSKNFDAMRGQISAALDSYVLGATILSEDLDEKGGKYSLVIRADINVNRLDNTLQGGSNMASASEANRSPFTFVFVARQQKSVQSFDDKIYKRADIEQSQKANVEARNKTSEGEKVRHGQVSTSDSVSSSSDAATTDSASVTTGGSTTKKADVVEWSVTNASEINTVVTGVFSAGGYEVVEPEFLEQESNGLLNIAAIRKDYSTGDDLSPATLRNTVGGVKAASIPFIGLGTLDVGLSDTDPVTGNARVYVTVTAKVLGVAGRFPKTISSVGPVQFAGLGPNSSVARTNALKLAADSSAKQLLNELNAKGVQ